MIFNKEEDTNEANEAARKFEAEKELQAEVKKYRQLLMALSDS